MDMDTRGRRVKPREAVKIWVGGLRPGVARIMLVGRSDADQDPMIIIWLRSTKDQERRHSIVFLFAWTSVAPSPLVHREVAQGMGHQVAMFFLILSRFWCVFVISTSLLFGFVHLPHLSSNPSFESPAYWYRSSRGQGFGCGATCGPPPSFCSLILVGGIRRS